MLIYVKGKGIVLREPSVVAIDRNTGEMVAVGEEAPRDAGQNAGEYCGRAPLREGVISNFHDTERMLRFFLNKVIGRKLFFKPRVVVCVPSGVTEVEKRSVIEATEDAGARRTHFDRRTHCRSDWRWVGYWAAVGQMGSMGWILAAVRRISRLFLWAAP